MGFLKSTDRRTYGLGQKHGRFSLVLHPGRQPKNVCVLADAGIEGMDKAMTDTKQMQNRTANFFVIITILSIPWFHETNGSVPLKTSCCSKRTKSSSMRASASIKQKAALLSPAFPKREVFRSANF
jgi:hypothetical protein